MEANEEKIYAPVWLANLFLFTVFIFTAAWRDAHLAQREYCFSLSFL